MKQENSEIGKKVLTDGLDPYQGAFIYDVRFLGMQVGQASSDVTK